MSKEKLSFFERLTGTVRAPEKTSIAEPSLSAKLHEEDLGPTFEDKGADQDGELTVDVYQTPEMVVVKSMIAGVRPEDLDISITRDAVTIHGKREEEQISSDGDFLTRELYWGSFSRTVELPEEIDVDEAEAIEKHGLLILKLPKLDRKKKSKLKVKTA